MPVDPELLIEARHRGLIANGPDPELLIEARRRGLISNIDQQQNLNPEPNPNYEVGNRSSTLNDQPSTLPFDLQEKTGQFDQNFKQGLLTNQPTIGIGGYLGRNAPAIIGSMVGATTGAIGGLGAGSVPLAMAGAGAGGAAGEAARQALINSYSYAANQPYSSPKEIIGNVGLAGLSNAAGEGIFQGGSKAAIALTPGAKRLGAQLIRIGPGPEEKIGLAAIDNPSLIKNYPSKDTIKELYRNFELESGTISPKLKRAISGQSQLTPSTAMHSMDNASVVLSNYLNRPASEASGKLIYDTDKLLIDVAKGKIDRQVLAQNLYEASQGAAYMKRLAKMGKPEEAANAANIGEQKQIYDDILERLAGNYKDARTAAFNREVGEAFQSFFPLNKNQSPNVLRSALATNAAISTALGAAGLGTYEGATGHRVGYAGLLAPLLISPRFAGLAIRGATSGGQVIGGATPFLTRMAAQSLMKNYSALQQAYSQQQ